MSEIIILALVIFLGVETWCRVELQHELEAERKMSDELAQLWWATRFGDAELGNKKLDNRLGELGDRPWQPSE